MDNTHPLLLTCLLCVPAIAAGLAVVTARSLRAAAFITAAGIGGGSALGLAAAVEAGKHGTISALGSWLYVDALSAFNLAVMIIVYIMSTVFAFVYFKEEARAGAFSLKQARQFAALWCGSFTSMTLVLVSNNLGIMWVGIEATTLLTAFLICIHSSRHSLEAMWKYLLICSVGVAFAFMGTLLAAASSRHVAGFDIHQALLWTRLRDHAAMLNPALIKAAFIFLVVGYGTKAGLAPMHNWLPDAHSQAPAPVSALFSGFMLNAALYCIMRYIPIVEAATGHAGWALTLLAALGVFSIGIGAAFIVFQQDIKRLWAYCSVEHIGIIALGLGLGGIGVFAALFHTLNHSLCKSLSFFAAGRLGQRYGTHDIRLLHGATRNSRLWGTALFVSLLALMGVAPFALFMSEFRILKAAVDAHAFVLLALFLCGVSVVFVGMLSKAIPLMWGESTVSVAAPDIHTRLEAGLVVIPLAALLALGCWMPGFLGTALTQASDIIRTGAALPPH
jgi:hydrogenase-4 component F